MQNKKSLLQRLLVIYVTFFIVLVAGVAHNLLSDFSKGYSEGAKVSDDLVKSWAQGNPRLIYMFQWVPLRKAEFVTVRDEEECTVKVQNLALGVQVEQNAPEKMSITRLAFSSLGGSPWFYAMTMLSVAAFAAIIVLMFMIIHSLRRSIREERALDRRNVWLLRAIGMLTILTEFIQDFVTWDMASRAARLLEGTGYAVDTTFRISYSTLVMGILILFAAEVFAIGQNLSEEQKLTI